MGLATEDDLDIEVIRRLTALYGRVSVERVLSGPGLHNLYTALARKGVYVAGGIAPEILDFLGQSPFRDRFESKGRMSDYVKAIPTFVVTQAHAALIGAASLLPALEARA